MLLITLFSMSDKIAAQEKNVFDDFQQILPRGGIPAVVNPVYVTAEKASIRDNTQQAIIGFVNELVKQHACQQDNTAVKDKSKELSDTAVNGLTESNIHAETLAAIEQHINQVLLDYSREPSNPVIKQKVVDLLNMLAEKWDSTVLSDKTREDINADLNARAVEYANK